jgi:colanic acid biosynthesis protein WcaH
MEFIDNELYTKVVELMPIACVDILIHQDDRILFVKRNQEPAKGKWWVVGGRLHKDETMEQCAIRKCKEEVGLDVILEKKIGVYDEFFDKSIQGPPTHTVCVAFLARPIGNIDDFAVDTTSDSGIVTNVIDERLDPYVMRVLVDSGLAR